MQEHFSVRGADELLAEDPTLRDENGVREAQAKAFAENIAALPPWQQILLMESEGPNIAAGKQTTLQLYRKIVNEHESEPKGFYLHKYEKTIGGAHAIVWYADKEKGAFRFNHEFGHRMDKLIASDYCEFTDQPDIFRTDAANKPPQWQQPVDAFIKQLPKATYASAREEALATHLLKYPPHERRSEAFAEMNAIYTEAYAHHKGNSSETAKQMEQEVPDIWPAYRDYVIPLAQHTARKLIETRFGHVYTDFNATPGAQGETNNLQYDGRIAETPQRQQGVL
ncbi:MAG: hypothetical protein MRY32_09370 [Rickettsiales bacterium]|nr:hypothetical protein [Rickettsiales bacterium]